jgi:glyoxylase-like metal-dependent hydrolase (beta-lactamase superfamily II)
MVSSAPFPLAAAAGGAPLLLRQLFDGETGTFTYLLADVASRQGVLIDAVYEQHPRDLSLIRELGIELVACLDTHVHADHVTGSWLMHADTGCAIGVAAVAGAENVTLPLRHGDRVAFGSRHLEVRATPGHTDGCLTFVLDDHGMGGGAPRRPDAGGRAFGSGGAGARRAHSRQCADPAAGA